MKAKVARLPRPPAKPEDLITWAREITNALYELTRMIGEESLTIEQGLDADRPTPTGSGLLYWATDTLKMYYDAP